MADEAAKNGRGRDMEPNPEPGMTAGAILVDARGLRCPLPALRLAGAVRSNGPGRYRLLADDPAARADIPALCVERGWLLEQASAGAFLVSVDDGTGLARHLQPAA